MNQRVDALVNSDVFKEMLFLSMPDAYQNVVPMNRNIQGLVLLLKLGRESDLDAFYLPAILFSQLWPRGHENC